MNRKILVVGSLNMDYVLKVPHTPVTGETLLSRELTLNPGGKGANQAYAAGKLGGDTAMLGCVGKDGSGDALLENLRAVGVDVSRISRPEGVSTGLAMICVNEEGDNSIVVSQGANLRTDSGYLRENLDLIGESGIVLFQLEIPLEAAAYGAKEAKRLGKTVILDPAPAVEDLPEELLQSVDVIKPNEIELGVLLGDPQAREHLSHACRELQKKGPKNVLVTLGGEGAFLLTEKGEEIRIPAFSVGPAVDTTAAGDCFTAALAVGLARGEDLPSAAVFAGKASGVAVTRPGAQSSIPSPEEVEALG